MPLDFLNQDWCFYNEDYGEIGIAVNNGNNPELDAIGLIFRNDSKESRMYENAALIANAPKMFRLLIQSLKFIDNHHIKNEIYDVLSSVINPDIDF